VLQFFVGGSLALSYALLFEPITQEGLRGAAAPILLSAVFAVGLAFTLQAIAQDVAKPTHAAILLSLESVFGALTGVFWLGESFSGRQATGCALMLGAALVAQWPQKQPAS
jgi:drug/metabolite transporter (DMT)-like permease